MGSELKFWDGFTFALGMREADQLQVDFALRSVPCSPLPSSVMRKTKLDNRMRGAEPAFLMDQSSAWSRWARRAHRLKSVNP